MKKDISTKRLAKFMSKRRAQLILLKNKPCMDCQGWFESCQMDFDHKPGTIKAFGIENVRGQSALKFYKEIAKCDLVCVNCHRLRTYKRKQYLPNKTLTILSHPSTLE